MPVWFQKAGMLLLMAPSFAAAANIVTDWSKIANPTGNGWTYGVVWDAWADNPLTPFTTYTADVFTGVDSWSDGGINGVYYNDVGSTVTSGTFQIGASEVVLAPANGLGAADAFAEYTLPATGDYTIFGKFIRRKTSGDYSVHIYVDLGYPSGVGGFSDVFYETYWTGAADAPFSLTYSNAGHALQAGSRIRFRVASASGYTDQYTGLEATVMDTSVPEPGTLLPVAAVVVAAALILRKRKARRR